MKIWFQNRRTKWKKQDGITNAEAAEHKNLASGKIKKNTASANSVVQDLSMVSSINIFFINCVFLFKFFGHDSFYSKFHQIQI